MKRWRIGEIERQRESENEREKERERGKVKSLTISGHIEWPMEIASTIKSSVNKATDASFPFAIISFQFLCTQTKAKWYKNIIGSELTHNMST